MLSLGHHRTMTISCHRPKMTCASVIHKAKTGTQQRNALLAIADRYQGKLRKDIINAINSIKDSVKINKLAESLASGAREEEILSQLSISSLEHALSSASETVYTSYDKAGQSTALNFAAGVSGAPKILFRFDGRNERAAAYLADRSSSLITQLGRDARLAVRNTLSQGVLQNDTPVTTARLLRNLIGLSGRDQTALLNYRRYLMTADRRAMARSIGGNAERTIEAAFRDDTMTASKVKVLVDRYEQRLLAARAQTIAQTETFRAVNAAALEATTQMIEQTGVPQQYVKRFWVATNDEKTRESHREIPFMNEDGVGIDEPFDSPLGPIMFPGDPDAAAENSINCRCTVVIRFTDVPEDALPPVVAGRSIYRS